MQPLYFDEGRFPGSNLSHPFDTGKDELAISAVAFMRQDPVKSQDGTSTESGPNLQQSRIVVTGRWPMANRYCAGSDSRDPFDPDRHVDDAYWNDEVSPPNSKNSIADPHIDLLNPSNSVPDYIKRQTIPEDAFAQMDGTNPNPDLWNSNFWSNEYQNWFHPTPPASPKGPNYDTHVRGFILTGQYTSDNGCLGSDYSVQRIEAQLSLSNSMGAVGQNLTNAMTSGGMVIIELHWQYHPLFFGPLFQGFINGDRRNDPMLYISGFFPVPSAEPTATP
jgi:hypothetical protein